MKKFNEIRLTKNKMDLNIRKILNNPPSPAAHYLSNMHALGLYVHTALICLQ